MPSRADLRLGPPQAAAGAASVLVNVGGLRRTEEDGMSGTAEKALAALRAELPGPVLLTDPDSVARFAHDEAE
ncbi:hypothetical protein [Saccharopolyspora sp. ASAGF58]|uniref:hypothetical protein n=1 Tax=Saccharopolyspora sp. ASAGF58 TaxID=2719023 RepID=UPI001B30F5CE|nr:hypothetical protein [Saccharopolyspora sp. ASAGF58]